MIWRTIFWRLWGPGRGAIGCLRDGGVCLWQSVCGRYMRHNCYSHLYYIPLCGSHSLDASEHSIWLKPLIHLADDDSHELRTFPLRIVAFLLLCPAVLPEELWLNRSHGHSASLDSNWSNACLTVSRRQYWQQGIPLTFESPRGSHLKYDAAKQSQCPHLSTVGRTVASRHKVLHLILDDVCEW